MRDDTERLQDILESIERIERYAKAGKPVFEQQELLYRLISYLFPLILTIVL